VPCPSNAGHCSYYTGGSKGNDQLLLLAHSLESTVSTVDKMEMEAWAGYILWELAIVWRIVLGPNSDRCMEYLPCYCTNLSTSKA
jgi:hypothetical protein